LTPAEQARIARLVAQSRQRYARPRAEVEAALRVRLGIDPEEDLAEPLREDTAAEAKRTPGTARRRKLE
jgi:hypothetical protein